MTTYLTGGWYSPGPRGGLRTEVLDGAIDAAGLLHRANIAPEVVSQLALRVRGLVRLGDRGSFGPEERDIVGRHLDELTGDSPELVSFVADCLDHVSSAGDLTAFYLHLVHITRMMQLLRLAQTGPTGAPTPESAGPAAREPTRRRRAATSKAPARRPSRTRSAAPPERRTPKRSSPKRKGRLVRRATTKRPR